MQDTKPEQKAEPEEEEKKADMFGEENPAEAPAQMTADIPRYEKLLQDYERHLLQKGDEQANQEARLREMAKEYLADWASSAEKAAEDALQTARTKLGL